MAYLILRERENLRKVMLKLQEGEITSDKLMPIGILQSALRGIVYVEVIPDSWPHFSALVIRPQRSKLVPNVDGYDIWYIFYGSDEKKFECLLRQPSVLDWNNTFFINSVPEHLKPAVESVSNDHPGHLRIARTTATFLLYPKDVILKIPPLPEGFHYSRARDDEMSFMASKWGHTFDLKKQTEAFRYQLSHLPHVVIRNQNEEIVAFNTLRIFGAMAIGWTREDCRGRGFFGALRDATGVQSLPLGYIPYGHVRVENKAAEASVGKAGRKQAGKDYWFLYTPISSGTKL